MRKLLLVVGLLMTGIYGCTVAIPGSETLFPVGSSFVVKGTTTIVDRDGPCRLWQGENGVTYYLFQDPRVDNEIFDQVTTQGVTSRLEIAERSDLTVTCHNGPVMEVQDVLEIVE
jgi:hypothetical protein